MLLMLALNSWAQGILLSQPELQLQVCTTAPGHAIKNADWFSDEPIQGLSSFYKDCYELTHTMMQATQIRKTESLL